MSSLPLREKLAYGVADIGASLSYNAINFFFLFFLVTVLGLSPGLAGIVVLFGRVIDAVTDPLMGALSDRTTGRRGRRKPYIWLGALPFGLTFALLWAVPETSQLAMFALAAALLTLHAVVFTVVQVPYMALTPELAPDYAARTSLTSYRIGFGTLASLIAAAAPPLLVAVFNRQLGLGEGAPTGWLWMGVLFGLVMTLGYLVMAALVGERQGKPVTGKLDLLGDYRLALAATGYPQVLLLYVVVTLGIGVISSMLPFYLHSALSLPPEAQTLVLGLLFVVAILSLPLWNLLAARLGKPRAFAVGLGVLGLSVPLVVLVSPSGEISAVLLISVALAGLGVGAALLFPWAMLPDVVEFDELRTGMRREGHFYALFTFGQKAAFALGAFANAQVLALVGYQRDAAVQSPEAILGIKLMVGPVAALVFVLALILAWRFPITKALHDEARMRLEARKSGL
jgi:glycoside/pentoside/hexuronide:cation symporter, GPH family